MKAIINGVEIECSVEEFKELVDTEKIQPSTDIKVINKPTKPFIAPRRATIDRTDEYKQIIEEAKTSDKSLRQLMLEKMHVKPTSHYKYIKQLVGKQEYATLTNKHQRKRFLEAHKLRKEQGITLTQALKIVDGKSTPEKEHLYMLQNRPKPIIDGTTQRVNLAQKATVQTLVEFPRIYPIHQESMPILKDMIKQMIADKSTLSFFSVKDSLRLTNDEQWDGHKWREFVQQVLMNKKQIAEYFLSNPHKLKIIIKEGFHYLTYEK